MTTTVRLMPYARAAMEELAAATTLLGFTFSTMEPDTVRLSFELPKFSSNPNDMELQTIVVRLLPTSTARGEMEFRYSVRWPQYGGNRHTYSDTLSSLDKTLKLLVTLTQGIEPI